MARGIRELGARLSGEIGWVVFHKIAEQLLLFVALKLLTNLLTPAAYAEYNLVLTACLLLGHLLIMPMQQAYLRQHHAAHDAGALGDAGRTLLRWYGTVTVGVAVLAAGLSALLSGPLGLERWSILIGGLCFAADRWRTFAVQYQEVLRQRRRNAIENVGFLTLDAAAVALAAWVGASASAALSAHATTAMLFGVLGCYRFVRSVMSAPPGPPAQLLSLVRSFGAPYGVMLLLQWLQGFADRFLVSAQLDLAQAGVYIAAYVVCGAPFMLAVAVLRALLIPVAYQRAKDVSDARQVWSADRLLLLGALLYGLLVLAATPLYLFFGGTLLRLLTNPEFALPNTTLALLALGRAAQCLGNYLEVFFAVHQRMTGSLAFRTLGSVLVIPICWYGIASAGLPGAALGVFVASIAYILSLTLAPGGLLGMVMSARRQARGAAARSEPS